VTKAVLEDLPRNLRRRLTARAVLRPMLTTAFLVGLYYKLPMDRPFSSVVGVQLAVGLLLVVALIVVQVRSIARSPYPRIRAIETLGTSLPLFLLIFAAAYFKMERAQSASFTQTMGRTDALYFTVTVFSSVGFGDISPRTETARIVTMIQMMGDLVAFGVVARIIVSAVRSGSERKSREARTDQPPSTP
jgi:hypothetical protein